MSLATVVAMSMTQRSISLPIGLSYMVDARCCADATAQRMRLHADNDVVGLFGSFMLRLPNDLANVSNEDYKYVIRFGKCSYLIV